MSFAHLWADLLHRVSLAHGRTLIGFGLEVDGDAEREADLRRHQIDIK